MVTDALVSNLVPFAGSGLAGFCMGYALRHVLRWIVIAIGIIAGLFLVGIQLMHKNGYISSVNWDKLGNDTSVQIQHWIGNLNLNGSGHNLLHALGIPVTSGLAIGFLVGFLKH
jgi:uncharacterized membrane protein (Fun14 family)